MKPNKRSSRLLALALSLVLSLSLSLPALAAGEDGIIYIHTARTCAPFRTAAPMTPGRAARRSF